MPPALNNQPKRPYPPINPRSAEQAQPPTPLATTPAPPPDPQRGENKGPGFLPASTPETRCYGARPALPPPPAGYGNCGASGESPPRPPNSDRRTPALDSRHT